VKAASVASCLMFIYTISQSTLLDASLLAVCSSPFVSRPSLLVLNPFVIRFADRRMMSGVDIKPDQECFFHFVNACSYNNPLKGLKIVNVLMNTSSMSLNLYNLMLQLLFTTGMPFEQSLAVLERIKNDGFEPNAVTYSLVIR